MKKLVILFYLMISSVGFAQFNNEEYFSNGVELYNEGKYLEAINQFKLIIQGGEHSEALYFNLGNSYYKINDIANSIYYYEKALRLNPKDNDVLNNLSYSQNMLIDKIELLPKNQVSEFLNLISNALTINQWLFIGIALLYLFLGAFLSYYFNNNTIIKKNYFSLSIVFFILSMGFVFNGINRFENEKNIVEAIIFENKIDFRTEPNFRSEVLFNLHEGTKVTVKEELNEWTLVQISNGNLGWIKAQSIKKID
jgi:tetratricopeptide (TPR) repeat protein|tara:strand:- start:3063 stop:3821 length:759 start_codon:yes stop_codon:yes gene_type:complete